MNLQKEITKWLNSRQNWQQEVAFRILNKGLLSTQDINEIKELSKTKEGQQITKSHGFPGLSQADGNNGNLRLISVGNIEGIDRLAPKKPLEFGDKNLTVVFGNNGSGKSGYTRIMKKVCGKSNAVDLKANVFKPNPEKQCCTITYELNGNQKDNEWNAFDQSIFDLNPIDIFDSTSGEFYLEKENEVSYQPQVLLFFDKLIKAVDSIADQLKLEKGNLVSKLPELSKEYEGTIAGNKYQNLKSNQTEFDLVDILNFEKNKQKKLDTLEERLKTEDPKKLADQKTKQKLQVEKLSKELEAALIKVLSSECTRIHSLKQQLKVAKKNALKGAQIIQNETLIDGVGSETWIALWQAARNYSEKEAYKDSNFPNTNEGARCLLCQQDLQPDAINRFLKFEDFVKGSLIESANKAEQASEKAINNLPEIPGSESFETSIIAAGLDLTIWKEKITEFWNSIKESVQNIKKESDSAATGLNKEDYLWLAELKKLAIDLGKEVVQLNLDVGSFDRENINSQKMELSTKKWTASQSKAIKEELIRLEKVSNYNSWISSTNTASISIKSGSIAELLITSAYVDRFNRELKNLGAHRIQVDLIKTRAPKGHALHKIILKGLDHKRQFPEVILSTGEKRIVSLAAFLADVTGREEKAPFIFDDPISSLDQEYEEKSIERLIQLSDDRQVIVFTHRLSFLGILESKANPNVVCVRQEPWGTGEPGEVPIYGNKTDKALMKLINDRLVRAEKVLNSDGTEAYYPLAKALCSDLRIIVERVVEFVLLADIIQRHRRDVMTKGKIRSLLKIQESDCEMIDDLMGRYSCYEHSQSSEAPIDVPEPDELKKDIQNLLSWHESFKKRKVS
jgi:energy-coupling factor transporter ATP-binding protein EcfA2